MKKYFFMLMAFSLFFGSLPLKAQTDADALTAAVDTIVRKYSQHGDVVDRIIDEVYQKNKTNAELLAKIAKCYYSYFIDNNEGTIQTKFQTNDTARAFKFIYRALEADKACAAAYILGADIITREEKDRAKAEEWYKKGIEANPNSQDLAIAYSLFRATDDMDAAIAELQKKGESDPTFNANLEIGRMYLKMNEITGDPNYLVKCGPYFLKCRLEALSDDDLKFFLIALDQAQLWGNLRTASAYGIKKLPGTYSITSYYFKSLVQEKEWDEALNAYQLLKKCENYKEDPTNEALLGNVLSGQKRYNEALEQYEKALNMEGATNSAKAIANNGIKNTINDQLKVLIEQDKYEEAAEFYKEFINRRKAEGKLDGAIYNNYANIFIQQSNKLTGEAKAEAFRKAGAIYKEWIENETIVSNIAIAHGRIMLLSQLIYGLEQNMDVIYEAAHDTELWYETLSETDKTDRSVEKNYLTALDLIIRYYFQTMSGTKPSERETLKQYGDKILDLATDADMLQRVTQMYAAWKIK